MKYSAEHDTFSKIITHLIIIIGLLMLMAFSTAIPGAKAPGSIAILVLFIAIFITWGFSPRYYQITHDGILIRRPFSNIFLPFEDMKAADIIDNTTLRGSIRLFGSGGLFGYLGIYKSAYMGNYQMWCTNRSSLVLIVCNYKKIIISPSDNLAFMIELNDKRSRQKKTASIIKQSR
ncbi:PH domain-containing protein [Chitinophaga sp. MM2321]|uniref:PH domain-containing protein n=1 Tax=Chitinophaga sp. MM2321 TaxID=3137178 RepID=UPI0032D59D31